jgi:hypothetical protein
LRLLVRVSLVVVVVLVMAADEVDQVTVEVAAVMVVDAAVLVMAVAVLERDSLRDLQDQMALIDKINIVR